MPGELVIAEGSVPHRYQFTASKGKHIVGTSVECAVVERNYIGGNFLQACELLPPTVTLENGNKEMEILLQFVCVPQSACPNFKIAIDWEEADDASASATTGLAGT